MMYLWKLPKIQMAFFLLLIYLSAYFFSPSPAKVWLLILALSSTLISDWIFTRLRHNPPFLLSAAMVSGLIIALLTDPNLPWYIPVISGVLAMFSKNFLRFSGRHIFNPAGFGLLLVALIFQTGVSWWAVSFQRFPQNLLSLIYFLILLSPAYVSLKRMRRYFTVGAFILIYGILFSLFFDPTSVFFALVMLPEPMTTPHIPRYQIIFGMLVAAASILISKIPVIPDPLLASLLLGNLYKFFKSFR